MPYIGRELERGTYLKLDDISSSFDGNKTIFNLTKGGDPFFPGSPQSIIVSVNGTILEPVTEYGIDSSKIVFATAPTAGHAFFSITLGLPFGVFDNGSIEDGSLTGFKLSNPFNYDNGLLFLNSLTDKVGIRTENPTHDLDVHGDVRIVGILTVGTSSLILDGSNNKIQVGTALTLSHNDGAQIGKSHLHSTGYDLKTGARIRIGNDNTFQIYHTTTDDHNRIESGGKQLRLISSSQIQLNTGTEHMAKFVANGSASLYHGMDGASAEKKIETTTTGATVTGKLVVTGDLDVQGTTTTLDTILTEVDKLEVGADNVTVGVAITQSGTGDALTIDDGNSRVLTVEDGGNVGLGTDDPSARLHLYSNNPTIKITDANQAADNKNWHIAAGTSNILRFQALTDAGVGGGGLFDFYRNNQNVDEFRGMQGGNYWFVISNLNRQVGIGTTAPKTRLHVYDDTPSDTSGILVSNVNYAANQDKPYLIVGTKGWTGATTNWNTFGFQHKIKSDHDGTPRLTIDSLDGELFTFRGSNLGIGVTNPQGRLHIPDGGHIRLGNDSDARLFHSGSHFVFNNYTGNTYFRINGTEEGIIIKPNDQVQLYYDSNLRFNTTADGIKVIGPTSGTGVGIGTTADHDPLILASFNNAVTNVSQFRILSKRDTDGTDWATSYTRLQQRIDVTDQAYIQFNGSDNTYGMEFGTLGDEKFAKFIRNGAVELYHNNGQRFNTTPQGINVTTVGDIPQVAIAQTTTTAFSVNGTISFVNANNTTAQIQGRTGSATTTGDIIFLCNTVGDESLAVLEDGKVRVPDRGKFVAGQGNDLEIFHNTSGYNEIQGNNGNIRIRNHDTSGPGKYLYLQSESVSIRSHTNNHDMINAYANAQVELYHNDVLRLSTTNTGVSITDNLKVAGISTFSGDINVDTGKTLILNSAGSSDPVIKVQGGGPNFIRFASDAAGSVNAESMDLAYRTTPNTIAFRRSSDAAEFLSIDADDGLVIVSNNLNVTGDLDVDGATTLDGLTVSEAATFSADVNVGDGSAQSRILIKKADNDTSDHIQFYNGTTRMGEIGCQDTSFLRINQITNKAIYTPRYIRADAGFFVDGTTKGINNVGNFVGGTIAGASDYDTLLRSDTNDTMNAQLTVGGDSVSANEGGQINLTLAPNSTLSGTDIVIDQYIDQLRFFEGSGGTARGATIDFTRITGNTDNEIFSSGLTGVGYTVTHLRSFGIPNGVVAISTSNASHIPLTVTNSGGAGNNTIITKFVGNSDGLEVRNINSGDYHIRVNSLNTGISFYNGGNGMQFLYDGSRKFSVVTSGLSLNDELTFEKDDEGVTTYAGGRFYKKNGGGIAIRQSSGNQTPIIENNAGTLQGTILHTGSAVEVTGNLKFSGDGLQLSDHYFQGYYDTANRQNYIHLYPSILSDRGTSASTTDIRAWTGSTFKVLQIKGDADPTWDGNKIIHAGNASTDLTQFLRSDISDTVEGRITFNNSNAYPIIIDNTNNAKIVLAGSSNPYIRFREGSTDRAYIQFHSTNGFQLVNEESGESLRIQSGSNGLKFVNDGTSSTVLHTGNIDDNDLPSGITISGPAPQLNFKDSTTDADDFFIHINSNKFYVLTDLDDDGDFGDDTTHHYPLVLDNSNKKIKSYGTPVLNEHQGFNPYDVVHGYNNSNPDTIRFNFTEMAMELSPPYGGTDTTMGLVFPAFRVNTNTGEKFKLSVQIRSAVSTTNGIYIRVYEYDAELPDGKTHVSNDATNAVVQEDTRIKSTSPTFENQGGDTDWRTLTFTYTPTSTAVWASVVVLNWAGHGTNSLFVRDLKRELDLSSVGVSTANQIVLGNDSTGSTARRIIFASADSGTVTIQADTDGGATYTPSTGTITSDNFSGNISGGTVAGTTGTFTGNVTLGDSSSDTISMNGDVNTNILPSTNGNKDLGNSGNRWGEVHGVTFHGSGANLTNVNAAKVVVSDESSDTTCHPLFATTNTGNAEVKVGSNLSFNSSTGALTATSFSGTHTGARTGNHNTDTGNRSTNGYVEAGRGSGSVAMTTNDGYGNANLCFNHRSGVPDSTDTTASSGRIECSVDSATANMYFELWDSVTGGSATGNSGTAGGGGQNGIQMHLTTTGVTINPFLALKNELRFKGTNAELEFNTGGPRLRLSASNQLSFHSGGGLNSANDERMRIDSSGIITMYNDLIVQAPSTTNQTRLHGGSIELNRSADDAFIDFKTSTSEDFDCRIQKSSNGLNFFTGGNNSTVQTLALHSNGNVSIPNGKLFVAEEVFFRNEFNLQGATTEATKHMDIGFEGHGFSMRRTTYNDQNHDIFLSVNANGAVTLQSNIGATSDAKLKKNITTISDGAIENIKKLRPVKFDWIADDKMNDNNGFIAQELKEVFPNLVYGTEYDPTLIDEEKGTKGGIKSEGYSIDLVGISANVTKALQEAIAKIETLEAEVAALKAKVG